MREYFGVLYRHMAIDIGVKPAAEAAHLTHKEVLALVKADFVDQTVMALGLPAVVAVAQLYQPACVLVHHMAVQVLGVARFVLTELAQVQLVTAVLLEMEVQLTTGGELNITLLTPVKMVAEMRICYMLAQVFKHHGFVVTIFANVGVLLVDFQVFNKHLFGREAFLAHPTDVALRAGFML